MKEDSKLLKQLKLVANSDTQVAIKLENERGRIFVHTGSLELTTTGRLLLLVNNYMRIAISPKKVLSLSLLTTVWEAK